MHLDVHPVGVVAVDDVLSQRWHINACVRFTANVEIVATVIGEKSEELLKCLVVVASGLRDANELIVEMKEMLTCSSLVVITPSVAYEKPTPAGASRKMMLAI